MAVDASLDARVRRWEERLARSADGHPPLTLTPAWWQERLLDWATSDPDFRVKLLRFVDVLPALRSARPSRTTSASTSATTRPASSQTGSGLAAQPVFRPVALARRAAGRLRDGAPLHRRRDAGRGGAAPA